MIPLCLLAATATTAVRVRAAPADALEPRPREHPCHRVGRFATATTGASVSCVATSVPADAPANAPTIASSAAGKGRWPARRIGLRAPFLDDVRRVEGDVLNKGGYVPGEWVFSWFR